MSEVVSDIKIEHDKYIWTIANFDIMRLLWPHDSSYFQYNSSDIKCQLSIFESDNYLRVKLTLYGCYDLDLLKSFHISMINEEETSITSDSDDSLVYAYDELIYTKCLYCSFKKIPEYFKSDIHLTITFQIYAIDDYHVIKKQINNDYESLFLNEKFSDITFLIDGKSIKAHKNILSARSTVFDAMLQHDMVENNKNIIKIEDFNFEVMLEFLRFLYCGKVKELENIAHLLILVAEKYNINDLKNICSHVLSQKLNIENACDTLVLSDLCNNTLLKKKTMNCIVINLKQIISTTGFEKLTKSKPHLLAQILSDVADKDEVVSINACIIQ